MFSDPNIKVLDFAQTEKCFQYIVERRDLLQFCSLLFYCMLFSSTLSIFTLIHCLVQILSFCLPQIVPGKPLPPMMIAWWWVRSGVKMSSLAGFLLCFWLWQFGTSGTVQHSIDTKHCSCPDSHSTSLHWCTPTEKSFSQCFTPHFSDSSSAEGLANWFSWMCSHFYYNKCDDNIISCQCTLLCVQPFKVMLVDIKGYTA